MASRKTILKAIHHLRASGCFNAHLEDPGAADSLATDWFASFLDLTDVQLMDACSRHLESEDGRKWPTKFDLREVLKLSASKSPKHFDGCDACDQTGWRELVKIHPDDKRERHMAPCSCPKGHHYSHPPPRPPNYPGLDHSPPQAWDVVVQAWERQGYQVLVGSAEIPHFALEDIDTSERTRVRLLAAKESMRVEDLASALAAKWRMG